MNNESPSTSEERAETAICPACGHADAIVRETKTRPLEERDLMAAWFFGALGVLAVLTGRRTQRLRCERCNCRFPVPQSRVASVLYWTGVTGLATTIMSLVASANTYRPGSLGILDVVADWCKDGAAHPLVAIAVIGVPAFAVTMTWVWSLMERNYRDAQLAQAVRKRDLNER